MEQLSHAGVVREQAQVGSPGSGGNLVTWYNAVPHKRGAHPAVLQRGDVVLQVARMAAQHRQLLARLIPAQPRRVLQQVACLPGRRPLQHRRRQCVQRRALLGVLCAGRSRGQVRQCTASGLGQRSSTALAPHEYQGMRLTRQTGCWGRVRKARGTRKPQRAHAQRASPKPNKPTPGTGHPCRLLPRKPSRASLGHS